MWREYTCERFHFEDHAALVVLPKKSNALLVLKTEYWDAFPEAVELPLLERGYTLCFICNDNRWGTEPDLSRKGRFVRYVAEHYGLDCRCIPVGMSCGGLIAVKFAAMFPELVRVLFLDAPVINFMSCPCGFGIGKPLNEDNSEILNALGLESISQLLGYRDMPLDKIPVLVQNRIPVALVAGDSDSVVPYCENGILVEEAYRKTDIPFFLRVKPGCDHHPHGMEDPAQIMEFLTRF